MVTKRANRVLWPQVIRLRLFNVHWQQETCWRTHTVEGRLVMRLSAVQERADGQSWCHRIANHTIPQTAHRSFPPSRLPRLAYFAFANEEN